MGVFQRNGKFYICYYFLGRRIRKKIGSSRTLADLALKKIELEIAENKYLDIKKDVRIKFEYFAVEYLEFHSKNKKSYYTDVKIVGLLKKVFGGKYLYEITSLDVEKFKSARAKEVKKSKPKNGKEQFISPATVNRALAVLKSMFNKAILWGKTESNPCKGVEMFKVNNQRLRFLEKEEIKRLLATIDDLVLINKHNQYTHLKPIVTVALYTGMRKSEILGLKWRDVDIQRSNIHLSNTKNGETRDVPMNDIVIKTIIAVPKNKDSAYIFCNQEGKPYGDIKKSFFTALKNAGIIDFRFHDLRHTFASQLVMSGVDLNTVRELLGHKTLAMTLRYAHLSQDHKKRAVDILARQTAPVVPLEQNGVEIEKTAVSEVFENQMVI